MPGPAKFRIIESFVSKYGTHWKYAIQVRRWWGSWTTVDVGDNPEAAPNRAKYLMGNPMVSAWYDKEGRKTSGPVEATVSLRNYWLGILAAFLCGACLVLLGTGVWMVGLR